MSQGNRVDNQTDDDLLLAFRNGDEEAFLALYHRHQGAVFRFALHMSGLRETAEEVTQEVFLTMLSSSCRFDPARGSLEGFLLGAARNQVRRHERLSRFVPSGAAAQSAMKTETADAELDLLRRAILALPARYREIVVLCDIEELSYAETARRLDCAIGTVRSRLHRARNMLAETFRNPQKITSEACKA